MSRASANGLPFTAAQDGLRLAVRLAPRAAAERISGVVEDGRGGWALKVGVTAVPVDGKANATLLNEGLRPWLRPV